jgi:transposase
MGTRKLELKKEEIKKLREIIKTEKKYRTVNRAQALILRSRGVKVKDIAFALNVWEETVYKWIKKYKKEGIKGLYEQAGRGRKSVFKDIPKEEIKEIVNKKVSVAKINAEIRDKYGIKVSNEAVRKFIKKNLSLVLAE